MSTRRIAVFSEGRHDLGSELDVELDRSALPALPRLVDRRIDQPDDTVYVCRSFHKTKRVLGGTTPKLAKKVARALREASGGKFSSVVIVVDRDRDPDRTRQLRQGRDLLEYQGLPPCAVGTAVETFDAWMIADPNAVEAAGGDKGKCHASPESLDGTEDRGRHPKSYAAAAFGGVDGLSVKYAAVARHLRIDYLERCCPQGFAPFAAEVRERIGPVVEERG